MSVLHLFENKHSEGSQAQKFMENSQNEQKTWKKHENKTMSSFLGSGALTANENEVI